MCNSNESGLVKRFAEVVGKSEQVVRHQVKHGMCMDCRFTKLHMREIRKRDQRGGAA